MGKSHQKSYRSSKSSDANLGSTYFENFGMHSSEKKGASYSASGSSRYGESRQSVHGMGKWENQSSGNSGTPGNGSSSKSRSSRKQKGYPSHF